MTEGLINCGTCTLQAQYRVALRKQCVQHGINEGDPIEVWIKPVKKENYKNYEDK